jgi:microcystin-dependent protein
MSATDPFIGEITMVGFNFAPKNWAFCNGQLLPINTNQALFSILGTTYGGNGTTNFALPDLRGRVPIHAGQGPGLTPRTLGEKSGEATHTLLLTELPTHNHSQLGVSNAAGTQLVAGSNVLAVSSAKPYAAPSNPTAAMGVTGSAGGSQPHENMQPYETINFVICLFGIFPSRN